MAVYTQLSARVGAKAAGVLIGLWYAILMALIAFCVLEDQAAFIYRNI
jgi:hypothetical protein